MQKKGSRNVSSELIPRPRDGMRTVEGRDPLAPRLPVKVKKAIDRESAWGLANAARAQAVGFVAESRVEAAELVTERTMLGLDRLHRVEAALSKQDPLKAERYNGLVEDFLLIARCELRNMTREF
jgi:hypothetical protein